MRPIARSLLAFGLLVAGAAGIETASAAQLPAKPAVPGGEPLVQQVDYYYRGHGYCWYYDGWHGPGWYWCGYEWRRGYGWGSPVWGWNGWAWSGPRFRGGDRFRDRGPVRRLERRGDRHH